jgi:hypothetical protein
MSQKILTEDELQSISLSSDVDLDIVRCWYKDFLRTCPKGKMVFLKDKYFSINSLLRFIL